MPIYEYRCSQCTHTFRRLVGMNSAPIEITCPQCQSSDVIRRLSRFSRGRSADDTLTALESDFEALGDTHDHRAVQRLVRDMGQEMGEDLEQDFESMMVEESQTLPTESL